MTWRNMSPEAIELEFNPRATARNVDARIAACTAASAATRARRQCVLDLRYGPDGKETLDIVPADEPNAPVLLFIHGGYWRAMDKSEYMELPGHDHFDTSRAVGDAESPLAQAMLRIMGL